MTVKILWKKREIQNALSATDERDKPDSAVSRTLVGMWDVPRSSERPCAKPDITEDTTVFTVWTTRFRSMEDKQPEVESFSDLLSHFLQ